MIRSRTGNKKPSSWVRSFLISLFPIFLILFIIVCLKGGKRDKLSGFIPGAGEVKVLNMHDDRVYDLEKLPEWTIINIFDHCGRVQFNPANNMLLSAHHCLSIVSILDMKNTGILASKGCAFYGCASFAKNGEVFSYIVENNKLWIGKYNGVWTKYNLDEEIRRIANYKYPYVLQQVSNDMLLLTFGECAYIVCMEDGTYKIKTSYCPDPYKSKYKTILNSIVAADYYETKRMIAFSLMSGEVLICNVMLEKMQIFRVTEEDKMLREITNANYTNNANEIVALAGKENDMGIWDAITGEKLNVIGDKKYVEYRMSNNRKYIVAARRHIDVKGRQSGRYICDVIDVHTEKVICNSKPIDDIPWGMAISNDGGIITFGYEKLRIYNTKYFKKE